jgi:hypothetical protein
MDTPQQKVILRQSAIARKVRAKFPEGTRVLSGGNDRAVLARGVVQRHVPGSNAQGGYLVVLWDNGHTGRHSAVALRREDAR